MHAYREAVNNTDWSKFNSNPIYYPWVHKNMFRFQFIDEIPIISYKDPREECQISRLEIIGSKTKPTFSTKVFVREVDLKFYLFVRRRKRNFLNCSGKVTNWHTVFAPLFARENLIKFNYHRLETHFHRSKTCDFQLINLVDTKLYEWTHFFWLQI